MTNTLNHYYCAEKYKHQYMAIAELWASQSKAVRSKVGSCIVLNNGTLACGFNGTPHGSESEVCEDCNNVTLPEVIHSESNAIDRLRRSGCTELLQDAVLFVSLSPCALCAKLISDMGICKVYYKEQYRSTEGIDQLRAYGVIVEQLREEAEQVDRDVGGTTVEGSPL